mgnify:CR=1 FL=1
MPVFIVYTETVEDGGLTPYIECLNTFIYSVPHLSAIVPPC